MRNCGAYLHVVKNSDSKRNHKLIAEFLTAEEIAPLFGSNLAGCYGILDPKSQARIASLMFGLANSSGSELVIYVHGLNGIRSGWEVRFEGFHNGKTMNAIRWMNHRPRFKNV